MKENEMEEKKIKIKEEKTNKKLKNKQGITLIALVITIIVLLILAGVSIAMLTGENGILSQAQNAREKTNKATEEEKIQMAVLGSSLTDKGYSDILDETSFKQELANQFESQELDVVANGDGSFIVTVEDTKRKYYVNDDKTVINSDNIIEIGTADELEELSQNVKNGNTYQGKAILLTNNINLEGKSWTPIGYYPTTNTSPVDETNKTFKGIFDGCGYEVDNFIIDTTDKVQGLFGLVDDARISNLTIGINSDVNGGNGTAGVVGYAYNGTKVYNCCNEATINGSGKNVGGIAGIVENSKVLECYNLGMIESIGDNIGGVAGLINRGSIVSNCYNEGSITGNSKYVGGIVGYTNSATVETAYNKGTILGRVDDTGGIVGKGDKNSTARNCYNIGEVNGDGDYIGGVAGHIQNSSAENCYNIGVINGNNATMINSVIGNVNESTVNNCYALEGQYSNETSGIKVLTSDELKKATSLLGNKFKEDTKGINDGYPILYWQ